MGNPQERLPGCSEDGSAWRAFAQILSEDSAELLRLAQLSVATDDNMDIVIMPCYRDQAPTIPDDRGTGRDYLMTGSGHAVSATSAHSS